MSRALTAQVLGALAGEVCDVPAGQQWILPIMRDCGPRLVNTLWRLLGNEQDVLDAYQECFCRLATSDKALSGRRGRAYVFRSGVNVALDMLRRRAARRQHEDPYGRHRQQLQSSLDPVADLSQEECLHRMRRAILQLPHHLQQVLVLRDLAEFPYEKVAGILGITCGTARVYRHQAVQQLAGLMHASRVGAVCDRESVGLVCDRAVGAVCDRDAGAVVCDREPPAVVDHLADRAHAQDGGECDA